MKFVVFDWNVSDYPHAKANAWKLSWQTQVPWGTRPWRTSSLAGFVWMVQHDIAPPQKKYCFTSWESLHHLHWWHWGIPPSMTGSTSAHPHAELHSNDIRFCWKHSMQFLECNSSKGRQSTSVLFARQCIIQTIAPSSFSAPNFIITITVPRSKETWRLGCQGISKIQLLIVLHPREQPTPLERRERTIKTSHSTNEGVLCIQD